MTAAEVPTAFDPFEFDQAVSSWNGRKASFETSWSSLSSLKSSSFKTSKGDSTTIADTESDCGSFDPFRIDQSQESQESSRSKTETKDSNAPHDAFSEFFDERCKTSSKSSKPSSASGIFKLFDDLPHSTSQEQNSKPPIAPLRPPRKGKGRDTRKAALGKQSHIKRDTAQHLSGKIGTVRSHGENTSISGLTRESDFLPPSAPRSPRNVRPYISGNASAPPTSSPSTERIYGDVEKWKPMMLLEHRVPAMILEASVKRFQSLNLIPNKDGAIDPGHLDSIRRGLGRIRTEEEAPVPKKKPTFPARLERIMKILSNQSPQTLNEVGHFADIPLLEDQSPQMLTNVPLPGPDETSKAIMVREGQERDKPVYVDPSPLGKRIPFPKDASQAATGNKPFALPPKLRVKLTVHEEVSSMLVQTPGAPNAGLSRASIRGKIFAQVQCSDTKKNAPFIIHLRGAQPQEKLALKHSKKYTASSDKLKKINIPKYEIGFVPVLSYRLTEEIEHMPVVLERKITHENTSIKIVVQARSNLTNNAAMKNLTITVAVPHYVDANSVEILRGLGTVDELKSIIKWKLPALEKGSSLMVSAQAKLLRPISDEDKAHFPVLLRCTSSADQISSLEFDAVQANGQKSSVTCTSSSSFRLLHRLV